MAYSACAYLADGCGGAGQLAAGEGLLAAGHAAAVQQRRPGRSRGARHRTPGRRLRSMQRALVTHERPGLLAAVVDFRRRCMQSEWQSGRRMPAVGRQGKLTTRTGAVSLAASCICTPRFATVNIFDEISCPRRGPCAHFTCARSRHADPPCLPLKMPCCQCRSCLYDSG